MTSSLRRAFNTGLFAFATVLVFPLLTQRGFRFTGAYPSAGAIGWLRAILPIALLAFVLAFAVSLARSMWLRARSRE
jgi:hypothetical protein